ncbi:hypothetical protein [Euzebya tangerina]|uniref:hypothetical protein n=1 Tax=Euzebya tangerina TaxID=591198 RepID=UPI0013C2FF2B|nr:hypothetical protein [Euzebya tangerina]
MSHRVKKGRAMKLSRRDQTVLGIGSSPLGALLLLPRTMTESIGFAIGIVGIAVLGSRPPAGMDE